MSNFITLTKDNFKKIIEENEFVIVDFWAPWCDPCVEFTPVLKQPLRKIKTSFLGWSTSRKIKK